jgi:hypothetical protein
VSTIGRWSPGLQVMNEPPHQLIPASPVKLFQFFAWLQMSRHYEDQNPQISQAIFIFFDLSQDHRP